MCSPRIFVEVQRRTASGRLLQARYEIDLVRWLTERDAGAFAERVINTVLAEVGGFRDE